MNKLSEEIIKVLNFSYKEDENDIKFIENYLNGMPNIENITISEIIYNSANILGD